MIDESLNNQELSEENRSKFRSCELIKSIFFNVMCGLIVFLTIILMITFLLFSMTKGNFWMLFKIISVTEILIIVMVVSYVISKFQ